jgi:hypothetical protein
MNMWLLAIVFDTVMVALLAAYAARLDKKCWDLLGVIKGMSDRIIKLEEKIKVGMVHSDIQE